MSKAHDHTLTGWFASRIGFRWRSFAKAVVGVVFLAVLIGFLMDGNGLAEQPKSSKGGQGKIEIAETVFDFGYMPQKGIFSHAFVAKNVGDGVLNIVKISPTCGCTTIPLKQAFLNPGEQVEIKVNFDTKNIPGKVVKKINVLSNDPVNGLSELYVKGIVGREPQLAAVGGPTVRFNKIDIKQRELTITNPTAKKRISLSILPLAHDFLAANLSGTDLGPGETATLTLSLVKDPPLGEYTSSITVECVADSTERISIPITGMGYAR